MTPQIGDIKGLYEVIVNALAKLLKPSMTTSTPAAPLTPPTKVALDTPSDILSRLPAEVRHMIYSHLNIPVGGHVWIDCPSDSTCTDPSHVIFHADAKWPMRAHAPFGVFQVRQKIENLLFYRSFRKLLAELDTGEIIGCNGRILMERNLLCVNKAMRTELMDLVFACNEIEVVCLMRNEPDRIRKSYWMNHIDRMNRIPPLPPTLAHMTSVTIRGCGHEMNNDCKYLQFVAMNLANLRCLTYHIQLCSLYLIPTEEVMALVQTFRAVTVTAKNLETLRFVWNEEDLTIGQDQDPRQQEMVLDKPKWGAVVPEVRQLLDELTKKGEAEHGRFRAKMEASLVEMLARSRESRG
ncbi:hypothetical protein G6011_09989 [Alternaria panax]|uniref:Uncharacterized protein n=1 Tax=Alternaria panax TaxID=48097 RepID=A0AAD4I7Q4_9PLEO|nr:hypothetical protein G6011_09989 [Alternaria panax]